MRRIGRRHCIYTCWAAVNRSSKTVESSLCSLHTLPASGSGELIFGQLVYMDKLLGRADDFVWFYLFSITFDFAFLLVLLAFRCSTTTNSPHSPQCFVQIKSKTKVLRDSNFTIQIFHWICARRPVTGSSALCMRYTVHEFRIDCECRVSCWLLLDGMKIYVRLMWV